jgi:nucleotide-binding universal stress UspA family protein
MVCATQNYILIALRLAAQSANAQIGDHLYKQIAVIFDESHEAERALATAISIAASLGSHLHILTVTKPPPVYTAYATAADPQIAQVVEGDRVAFYTQLQAKVATVAEAANVLVTKYLVEGDEVESIVDLLRSEQADLLVLGLHRKTSTISRLWNKVFELAQDSPCSVLGVH